MSRVVGDGARAPSCGGEGGARSSAIELLSAHADATAENLVRGNAYIDSASKHSRDFRLVVLTILFVATFALLFLDWYMP